MDALRSDTRGVFMFYSIFLHKKIQKNAKMQKKFKKICIYQKKAVPLHRHLKRNGTNQIKKPKNETKNESNY